MKPDEPKKELKPEELLTAMVGKTIADMTMNQKINAMVQTGVFGINPEKKSSYLHGPFFKIDPQSNFSQPPD